MAILKKEELFNKIHSVLGKLETDESVSFLEDMTDTYNHMEEVANGDGEDWKQKYLDNDRAWQKRYTDRFIHNPSINNFGTNDSSNSNEPSEIEKAESLTYNDLFK